MTDDREKILAEVEKRAYDYEATYGGCSQCVLAAIKEVVGLVDDNVFKAATGLTGGIGLSGSACGALTGAVLALSMARGRTYDNFADPDRTRFESFKLARKLADRYREEFGSLICKDVQTKLMGRSFDLFDPDDYKAFLAAGGHDDKCTAVAGKTARMAVELLMEEGLI
ncbi:MAG TPA: C_GCAxxG_C_C family protein [Firmicutes bacterium]|nr:C_GCAxxG_C_C family protein [Bacillota bacterium]